MRIISSRNPANGGTWSAAVCLPEVVVSSNEPRGDLLKLALYVYIGVLSVCIIQSCA